MNKKHSQTAKTVLTAVLLGAGIGAACYVTQSKPVVAIAVPVVDTDSGDVMEASTRYWNRVAVESSIEQYRKLACRTLYGEHYQAVGADCNPPIDCTACRVHKGPVRNAVIHADGFVRVKATPRPDYVAMMRQDRLVFQMSAAARRATEASREAYDHVVRCQAIYAGADIQCN